MIYCGHTKCAVGPWTHICLLLLDEGSESWPLAAFIPFSITETIVVQQSWSGAIVLRYCMDIVSRGLTAVVLCCCSSEKLERGGIQLQVTTNIVKSCLAH